MQKLVAQNQVLLNKSYQQAFGFSVLIHLILVCLISFFEPPIVPATKTLLEIDLRQTEGPTQLKPIKNKMRELKAGSISTKHRSPSLKDLGLSFNRFESMPRTKESLDSEQTRSGNWTDSGHYFANEMRAFDDLSPEKVQFEKTLWKEINQSVVDSKYLSEYNHAGKVHIMFEINRDGLLLDSSLRACGADGVLKVLAARAVRKALFNERHEIKFPSENQTFYAQFTWSDYGTCKSLRGINKNFLSFCHYAENKAKTFSNGEKAATYLKSLKYGLGAIEEIKEYKREESHRKTQFDPFISLKNDPDWNLEC